MDLREYLHGVNHVTVGGETGREARLCDYGKFITMGNGCYANFNFTVLDTCPVTIGDNGIFC